MNLYVAGLYTTGYSRGPESNFFRQSTPNAQAMRQAIGYHLESYHYISKGRSVSYINADRIKIFLDSGAYSAFSLGATIGLEEYAEFIKAHQNIIEVASVLDAIGDPVGTYHNQNKLEALGCEVLPCYHFGEPIDLCEYYVRNYEYITIGGMVPIPNNKLEPWLDEIWCQILTDGDGIARTKVHGFGMTARKLMLKYPWYSVDSSSWVQIGANGGIMLPEFPQPIAISLRSPRIKEFMKHYATFEEVSKSELDKVLAYYGTTAEEVGTDYRSRWSLNAYAFHRLGVNLGPDHWRKPFRSAQGLLF